MMRTSLTVRLLCRYYRVLKIAKTTPIFFSRTGQIHTDDSRTIFSRAYKKIIYNSGETCLLHVHMYYRQVV